MPFCGSTRQALPGGTYRTATVLGSAFYRWTKQGGWAQGLATLQTDAHATTAIDWTIHFVDRSIVRAHQHAAGAKRGTRRSPAPPPPKR
jgi:transposase